MLAGLRTQARSAGGWHAFTPRTAVPQDLPPREPTVQPGREGGRHVPRILQRHHVQGKQLKG